MVSFATKLTSYANLDGIITDENTIIDIPEE
jgi:hypothetical protein